MLQVAAGLLLGRDLRLVVGKAIEDESFFLHGAVQVDRALVGIVVKIEVKSLVIQGLLERYWCLHFPQQNLLEIDVLEEGMILDLLSVLAIAQSFLGFQFKQPFEQRLRLWRKVLGNWHWLRRNLP